VSSSEHQVLKLALIRAMPSYSDTESNACRLAGVLREAFSITRRHGGGIAAALEHIIDAYPTPRTRKVEDKPAQERKA
jgi:hypothetical protein